VVAVVVVDVDGALVGVAVVGIDVGAYVGDVVDA